MSTVLYDILGRLTDLSIQTVLYADHPSNGFMGNDKPSRNLLSFDAEQVSMSLSV